MADLTAVFEHARSLGYGLQAVIKSTDCPEPVVEAADSFDALWIVCNTGDRVQQRWLAGRDPEPLIADEANLIAGSAGPLDDFCRAELSALLIGHSYRMLFPHDYDQPLLPLVTILQGAGLLRPSPVMNSLHDRYGSWWAVRAVIALNYDRPAEGDLGQSPCLNCDAPCIRQCPAGAVSRTGWAFELCRDQRLQPDSGCLSHCPARQVCPAGVGFRYSEPVQRYHYRVSLNYLRAQPSRN